ncbi:hypothetical protein [Ottowia caeni]|uniref:hypothetical protein n=1 Tax=Ottowia caeni TaxID=2870339 RepID=UPI003D7480E3
MNVAREFCSARASDSARHQSQGYGASVPPGAEALVGAQFDAQAEPGRLREVVGLYGI